MYTESESYFTKDVITSTGMRIPEGKHVVYKGTFVAEIN